MKGSDIFPGKWLKATDLNGTTPTVTIDRVAMETVGPNETKPVVYFVGKEKGVVLNKTNFATIEELTGEPDTDDWKGARIKLIAAKVDFKGKLVLGIRIEEPAPKGGSKAAPVKPTKRQPPPPVADEDEPGMVDVQGDDDDEIPF